MSNVTKSERLDAKLIRHNPPKRFKFSDLETTIHIKSSTPYISAIKRVSKLLKNLPQKQPKARYVTIMGMGAAIEQTVAVGLHFQENEGCKIDVLTKSVEVLDEFDDGNEDNETIYRKRKVTAVEIHIFKTADLV